MPTPKKKITELTRTDIVDALLLDKEQPFHGKLDLISFLKRVWPLESMPSEDNRFENAEGDIWQHTVNNYDYDESELLYKRLRINEVPDKQFVRFLDTCMNPVVARDPKPRGFGLQPPAPFRRHGDSITCAAVRRYCGAGARGTDRR